MYEFRKKERIAANHHRLEGPALIDLLQKAIDRLKDGKNPDAQVDKDEIADKDDKDKNGERRNDIKESVDEMVRTVKLNPGSIYDYVFWQLYTEDNPITTDQLKIKLGLAFGVHVMAIYYYFINTGGLGEVYYGDYLLNVIRIIATLLLHLSSYTDVSTA